MSDEPGASSAEAPAPSDPPAAAGDAASQDAPVEEGLRGWVRWALVDPSRGRPRLLLRLGVHALLVLLGYVAGAVLVLVAGGGTASRAAAVGVQTLGVVLASWGAARWLDRRAPGELVGAFDRAAVLELVLGTVLGTVCIGGVAGLEVVLGVAHYSVITPTPTTALRALAAVLFFVAVAIDEELWFRGYVLTNVSEALEARLSRGAARGLALVASAVIFGLAHALNPNATIVSTIEIAAGGILLGVSFAISGRLWVALGLHFAWNTAQCFLDMPVSGQVLYDALFVQRDELGDDLVTGGAFGPEAGLLGLAAMCVGTVACVIHARRTARARVANLDAAAAS